MLPNNDEIMYRYSQMRSKEIRNDVEASRDNVVRTHILQARAAGRRRLAMLAGLALIGLTVAVTMLVLGWVVL